MGALVSHLLPRLSAETGIPFTDSDPAGDDDGYAGRRRGHHLEPVRKRAEGMKDVGPNVANLTRGFVAIGRGQQRQSLNPHGGFHQAVADGPPGFSPSDDAVESTSVE